MKNHFSKWAVCGALGLLIAACTPDAPKKATPPTVPVSLQAPETEVLSLVANAKGVQVYECRATKDDATKYEWVLKGPDADLFDQAGKKIGHHLSGPTWESTDGSKVVGEVKGREPSKDANTIPWLLLSAKAHEGDGVFSRVTSIQRLDTVGGSAPAGGCTQADSGKELRVPYTATYYFYIPR